jgi:uncharacterized protein with GYD domain
VARTTAIFEKNHEKMRVKIKDSYTCLGEYDIVSITEAANDERVVALSLRMPYQSIFTTTTMKAQNADDVGKIYISHHFRKKL